MLFFHPLQVFQIKVFQKISSPKFCAHFPDPNKTISVVKDGVINFHNHLQDNLKSHTMNDSDATMISSFN